MEKLPVKHVWFGMDGLSIEFSTRYPLPNLFKVILKGQTIIDLDREGIKAIAKIEKFRFENNSKEN